MGVRLEAEDHAARERSLVRVLQAVGLCDEQATFPAQQVTLTDHEQGLKERAAGQSVTKIWNASITMRILPAQPYSVANIIVLTDRPFG